MRELILIVEDEPGIADTLQYALRTDGFEPLWCDAAEAALAQAAARAPALAILDVGLPDLNGFELFRRLRALADMPVIFLTARGDEIDRVVGLELGADDYVPKPFSPRELVARVRTVLRRSQRAGKAAGGAVDAAAIGTAGTPSTPPTSPTSHRPIVASEPASASPTPFAVDEGRRQIRYYGRALDLSRYEYGLLRTLVQRPGHVYSRERLLELVWDEAGERFDRTVDAHVKTLRAKLKAVAPGLDAIRTHRGSGYALAEDLPANP